MEAFIEWLKGIDYTALYAMLGTFLATWGGSIVALVIGLLKQRAKNFDYQTALNKLEIKLSQDQTAQIEALTNQIAKQLTDVQKTIITNNKEMSDARMQVINQIVEDANASLNEFNEMTSDESFKGLN